MFEQFTPPQKKTSHRRITQYYYLIVAWIGSQIFLNTLLIGAIFHHLYDVVSGREKFNQPIPTTPNQGYMPRKPYPNVKSMKLNKNLRYFALQMGLDLQEYVITTEDGYVLSLHRLVIPNDPDRDSKKPVLLQHGLLASSGAWISGGFNSLAYHFVESGYDVWLGNNRCGFEPRHKEYSGNLMHNEQYWDWDIRELAYYDLPCIIDNVLSHKPNHDKLIYVGHSQGCTQSFLMLRNGNLTPYHEKIEYFFALAPAIFPGKLFHDRKFIKFLHHLGPKMYKLIIGTYSFIRALGISRNIFGGTKLFGDLSYIMFKYLFGWNGNKWDQTKKIWHFNFIFNCSYVSAKLMNWWLSHYVEEGFSNQLLPRKSYETSAHYEPDADSSCEGDKTKSYFPFKSSWFQQCDVTVPMLIFTCDLDYLVDGKRLTTHMSHFEPGYTHGGNFDYVELHDYSHLDAIWSEDVIGRIGMVICDKLTQQAETEMVLDSEKTVQHQLSVNEPIEVSNLQPHFPIEVK
jgi:pimeloyl-ACP methyl ester carboxylesterase